MKALLCFVFVILAANLGIDLLDSNMNEIMKDRSQTIERTFQ